MNTIHNKTNSHLQLKTILLICIAVFSINLSHCQVLRGFASLGMIVSQLDGDEVYGFKHVGLTGGLGVMLPFNIDKPDEGFMLSTEILFSQRGAKNTNNWDPFGYTCNLNYIDIPLMIHYMDKRAGAGLGVGLQYGRLIKSKETWILPDPYILDMDRPLNIDDAVFKKNDISFVADFRFNIWRGFKADVRWQYSLTPIREDFEFYNSYDREDLDYFRSWKRDFKSNYVTIKLIYVINEPVEQTYTKKFKRRGAY